jgi:lysine N6-hydroxylase
MAAIHDELYRRSVGGSWPRATMMPGVEVRSARTRGAEFELGIRHVEQGTTASVRTSAVVAATGYAETPVEQLLGRLAGKLERDASGRFAVDAEHRLRLPPDIGGSIFVQNAERHTHGAGAPDLGMGAWRSASIINAVCARTVYPLPERTAFTTFGLRKSEER